MCALRAMNIWIKIMIKFDQIRHRAQPYIDCEKAGDLRGRYFGSRVIWNVTGDCLEGCVLYRCVTDREPKGALVIQPLDDIRAVSLYNTGLRGSEFSDVSFDGAYMVGVDLSLSRLYGVSFRGSDLGHADFQAAEFEDLHAENADLYGANFRSAKIYGGSLKGADLDGAIFDSAYLMGVDLRGKNTETAIFDNVKYDADTKLPENITQDQLDEMTLVDVD